MSPEDVPWFTYDKCGGDSPSARENLTYFSRVLSFKVENFNCCWALVKFLYFISLLLQLLVKNFTIKTIYNLSHLIT